MNEKVRQYIERHGIPKNRIPDEESPEYEFSARLIERETDGSCYTPEQQEELAIKLAEQWAKLAGNKRPFQVLDVGCGQGYFMVHSERLGMKLYGLNASFIEAKLASHGVIDEKTRIMRWDDQVERPVKVGSALDLQYEDESMDGVSLIGVLMMLPQTEKERGMEPIEVCRKSIEETYSVLRKGGYLNLGTLHKKAQPAGVQTENYIFFNDNSYLVRDREGEISYRGNVGIFDLLQDRGFKIREYQKYQKNPDIIFCTAMK
jgi:SAM-dependent methyltransferase